MDCEEALRMLYEGTDETAGGDLADHLKQCEACRTEAQKLKRLEEVVGGVRPFRATRKRMAETIRLVEKEAAMGKTGIGVHVWGGLAAAAAILLTAGVMHYGNVFRKTGTETASEQPVVATAAEPRTAAARPAEATASETRVADAADRETIAGIAGPEEEDTDFVARLVQADLALAEAEGAVEKAVIFCDMSKEVLLVLKGSIARGDETETHGLGLGYRNLVNEGILANISLAEAGDDTKEAARIADAMETNCGVLKELVAGDTGRDRVLLAEALMESERCLAAAKHAAGF
ncbi:MAG: hypothetical protein JW909_07760 [Planctomycetes bacterium]|nr:hypothetical protein [Planctomycetota bacterium]